MQVPKSLEAKLTDGEKKEACDILKNNLDKTER